MFSRVCDLNPVRRRYDGDTDFAIMVGIHGDEYRDLKRLDIPYILIASDIGGMRWPHKKAIESDIVLDARAVLTNTPDTLAWMQENYGLVGGETIMLRPLADDLDFEPLEKLPGRNLVYAGGLTANESKYDYRDYLDIFALLEDAGWKIHLYPSWGHTRDLTPYEQRGYVIHQAVDQSRMYREMSQYQAGFQGYGFGVSQHYIEAALPNKLWDYLSAGIPTLGYNTGRGGAIYDGKWGVVADTAEDIPAASELVLDMVISDEMRREQVIDNDLDIFERLVEQVMAEPTIHLRESSTIKVGIVGVGDIGGQISTVPPAVREHTDIECYGFSKRQSKFDYPLDEHDKGAGFLQTADIIQVDVTHKNFDKFPCNPNAARIIHQHGHLDRPGDAPRSELDLDKELGATRIVSTLNLLSYVRGDVDLWMPSMLDPAIETMTRIDRNDGVVRVVHSPSRRSNKQTEDIIAAVKLLQAFGESVELDIIEGVSHGECMERKAFGDICFDQLTHCYGQSAIEAMYLGIPVIVGMDDETDATVFDVTGMRPYVRATAHDLALVLHDLIVDEEKRKELASVGMAYARKYHTAEAVAKRREKLYQRVLSDVSKRKTVVRPVGRPLKYPVKLGLDIPHRGRIYPKGSRVDHTTAVEMKDAGLLTDPRIM